MAAQGPKKLNDFQLAFVWCKEALRRDPALQVSSGRLYSYQTDAETVCGLRAFKEAPFSFRLYVNTSRINAQGRTEFSVYDCGTAPREAAEYLVDTYETLRRVKDMKGLTWEKFSQDCWRYFPAATERHDLTQRPALLVKAAG